MASQTPAWTNDESWSTWHGKNYKRKGAKQAPRVCDSCGCVKNYANRTHCFKCHAVLPALVMAKPLHDVVEPVLPTRLGKWAQGPPATVRASDVRVETVVHDPVGDARKRHGALKELLGESHVEVQSAKATLDLAICNRDKAKKPWTRIKEAQQKAQHKRLQVERSSALIDDMDLELAALERKMESQRTHHASLEVELAECEAKCEAILKEQASDVAPVPPTELATVYDAKVQSLLSALPAGARASTAVTKHLETLQNAQKAIDHELAQLQAAVSQANDEVKAAEAKPKLTEKPPEAMEDDDDADVEIDEASMSLVQGLFVVEKAIPAAGAEAEAADGEAGEAGSTTETKPVIHQKNFAALAKALRGAAVTKVGGRKVIKLATPSKNG